MGFSVSASAAIIFISILLAASTLYSAWDNSYTRVQAAREDWYDLKLSQLNTFVDLNSSLGSVSIGVATYNITLYIQNYGPTLYVPHWTGVYDGNLITLSDVGDDGIGFLGDYTYVLPGESIQLNVTNIALNNNVHRLYIFFENGCWVAFSWYYDNTNVQVRTGRGCPTEVS